MPGDSVSPKGRLPSNSGGVTGWSDRRSIWSPVNFACPGVRERAVEIIRDVANRYDVDGVDLDYLRHTCYFKETQRGEPATQEQAAMLAACRCMPA